MHLSMIKSIFYCIYIFVKGSEFRPNGASKFGQLHELP